LDAWGREPGVANMLIEGSVGFSTGFGVETSFATCIRVLGRGDRTYRDISFGVGLISTLFLIILFHWALHGYAMMPVFCGAFPCIAQRGLYMIINSTYGPAAGGVVVMIGLYVVSCFLGIVPAGLTVVGFALGALMGGPSGHSEPFLCFLGGAFGFGSAAVHEGLSQSIAITFYVLSGLVGVTASSTWLVRNYWASGGPARSAISTLQRTSSPKKSGLLGLGW